MGNGMICSAIRLDMKQNIYLKRIVERRPLQCLFILGLIANRWKEAPRAHCRLYPLDIRISHTLAFCQALSDFVKSIVAQTYFEGQY